MVTHHVGEIRAKLKCPNCGHDKIEVDDDPTPESTVRCPNCGAEHGTYGELREVFMKKARPMAREHFKKMFKEALKGRRK